MLRKTKRSTYCIIPFLQNSRKCQLIYSGRKRTSDFWGGEGFYKRSQGNFGG